jgi:predicted DNA-binding transcriptional regulator AlpA
MTAPAALPFPPRGVNREQAAAYVGVSPGLFDRMVEDGRMPKPRQVNARRVYDLRELDQHFDRLPHAGSADDDEEENPLDRVSAI